MSKTLHIVPGLDDVANGMVVVAKLLAKEQGDAEVVDLSNEIHESGVEEVWVHGMWLPKEWLACWRALRLGKRLVRMTHGSLSPIYLKYQSPLKKWLVGPIERWCLRRCDRIVATCEAEKGWIEKYLGKKCPEIEVMDIKRFFNINHGIHRTHGNEGPLHLLYLGRQHPLKGLEYLEEAIISLPPVSSVYSVVQKPELRIVSSAFGEELEKVWEWCDVLVLPTLSENFGLVIAEALERGKRVITTDGAPAWGDGLAGLTGFTGLYSGYGGRLVYLKGYRDGTDEERVELLKRAIERICK